jgi:hypothetical protein
MFPTFEVGAPNTGFILSEANGHRSRENGIVASGQGKLAAGTVVTDNGSGKLIAYAAGDVTDPGGSGEAAGIILYNIDATDMDAAVSYIARDAEVNVHGLVYPEDTTGNPAKANMIASLALLGIIVRE